jgi:hypothetical protein
MFANMFSATPPPSDGNPGRMKGREPLQGVAVAVIVAVGAVLDLVVTTGAGAPKHPNAAFPVIAVVLAVGLAVSVRFRNRLLSPFLAIFAAFFATLGKAPRSLGVPHIVVLVTAVGFALIVSMRQRREQKAITPTATAADRRAANEARRRRRKGEPEPEPTVVRPVANRRYTPPKKARTPPR